GGLTKSNSGTLELTGVSSYSSATTVTAGVLLVNGTLSNSAVQLNGGFLQGNGTVKGVLVTGGKLSPGDGFGALTSTADVTLQSTGRFESQIFPMAPDPHDVLKVQGAVTLGGAPLTVLPFFLPSIPPPNAVFIDDSQSPFTFTSGFNNVFSGAGNGFLGNSMHFANP